MSYSGQLSALLDDPALLQRVTASFVDAVAKSFEEDQTIRSVYSYAETKRRFEICARVFCHLRGDLKWSIERALDMMPYYMRCELEGIAYSPEANAAHAMWAPTGGKFALR